MVQRKVSGGSSLKTSSSQHQDATIKNRGADMNMKKKIKKSRSVKHPDVEFFKKKEKIPQEQKSPSEKKTNKSTPNYMKSTTSSDAKKENSQSQVSFRNLLPPSSMMISSGRKNCGRRNYSVSNSKSSETGVQQKLKTLTKTTSFKPSRNKCSVDFKRKTCSSTLKDSKFPGYLKLDPGGSEAEGTSAINVCPYTYCSLNGHHHHHHHHHPLPPLKAFMSARRRMLKTQRSIKLGCLSPRPSSKPNNKEAIIEEMKAESPSNNSMEIPDDLTDFFIDVYSKEKEAVSVDSDENGDIMEMEKEEEETEDLESGNSDIDWEGRKYSTLYLDDVDDESSVIHQESILKSDELKSFDEESLEHFQESVNQSYDEDHQITAADEIKKSDSMESFKQNLNNQVRNASVQTEVEDELKISHLDYEKSWTGNEERNGFYQCDARIIVNCINLLQLLSGNVPEKKMDSNSAFKVNAAVQEKAPFAANITIEIIITLQQDSSEKNQKNAMEEDEKPKQPEPEPEADETRCNTSESEEKLTEDLNIITSDQAEITVDVDAKQELKKTEMEGDSKCRMNKRKISTEEQEGGSEFNPKAPNFLPLEPEEKPEKVDLRHQMMDDRRNTEEWMIDYALQKTLTKLAPAPKKKVALLVEAFEKVMPILPRCDSKIRHSSSCSSSVESPRPIQACS